MEFEPLVERSQLNRAMIDVLVAGNYVAVATSSLDIWLRASTVLRGAGVEIVCFSRDTGAGLSPVSGAAADDMEPAYIERLGDHVAAVIRGDESVDEVAFSRVIVAPISGGSGPPDGAIAAIFPTAPLADDARLMMIAVVAASAAIPLARLAHETRVQAEVAQARREISRNLHDGPAQDLALASMALQHIQDRYRQDAFNNEQDQPVIEVIERANRSLREFIGEIRTNTAPVEATDFARHAEEWQVQAALAIIREAMLNSRKHANANAVHVVVQRTEAGTQIEVFDEGKGFNVETSVGQLGLKQMREIAAEVGGTIAIESAPGQGTTIRFVAPG